MQSVATRLVVERERERMAFVAARYWGVEGTFTVDAGAAASAAVGSSFTARLSTVDGVRVATGRDFDDVEQLKASAGKKVVVKDGRFGPYVTDGQTNITVPRGKDPEQLTAEEAYQLLADKRAKGPATRGGAKKPTARRAPTKKTTTRKKA
ncbi:DNA topoisomerase [Micrococcus terreus]|uniref:DNA topoisomerase n=1 Tax=Micrococcus terreus TaxID=574650 RepID=A0A1I7MTC4_9MICC|nr:DNA topoisomerase [Micrococcus terreus]